jgi:hypothetical protein
MCLLPLNIWVFGGIIVDAAVCQIIAYNELAEAKRERSRDVMRQLIKYRNDRIREAKAIMEKEGLKIEE